MKKALAILIAAAMLFACVGCGEEPVENTQTTTTEMEMTTNTDTDDTAQDTEQTSASDTAESSQKTKKTSATKVTTTTAEKTYKSKTSKFLTASYKRYKKYITVRGGMKNTGYKIANDLELKVAFMGGSVTAGMGSSDNHKGGFRSFFFHEMRTEYLAAKFTQIGSTLGGNGSQYGVYITEQMIATQKPDLVFIEYAINNAYDGVKEADKLWNHYETMIHTIYKHNPYADIVFLYVSDQRESDKDIIPIVEEIAEKYQLTSINLHQAILDYIEGQGLKWSHYYGEDSVHCNDNGYQLMGKILHGAVQYAMSTSPYTYAKLPCPAPKGTIQSEAKAVAATSCTIPAGWKKSSDFSYEDSLFGGSIQTTETGKTITVKFKGTHFGVLVEFAENAGILEYSVDGGEYQQLDCYLNYSNPKARMLVENADNKEHTITMRMSKRSHMAIAAYLLNGTIISVS